MSSSPDPKPRSPIRDPELLVQLHRAYRGTPCWACRKRPGHDLHHISMHPRDDTLENLAWLCGSGSSGCHGAWHGNPYVDSDGERWDAARVRAALHL